MFNLTKLTQQCSSYLEDYELQNTDLVIDGNDLINELLQYSNCHSPFGGDYDEFDRIVSHFFDCLLKCNVKPLVLLHGSCTESQIPISLARLKQRIERSLTMTPETPKPEQERPLFLKHVFIQCLKEKDIPLAQCQFDADNSIVAIAKALNCPVLANASYYYLYEALYIPNGTVIKYSRDHLDVYRETIPCKIYRLENLLNKFEGLNHHTLSLIDVLDLPINRKLDHSHVTEYYENTFRLIAQENIDDMGGESVFITKALCWLRKYTLEEAIAEIIRAAPPPMRPELLKIIETNINKYTNPFSEAFTHLMIPEECFSSCAKELYRFKGNIETLPYRGVHYNQNFRIVTFRDPVINELPQWFKHKYSLANIPGYALRLMQHNYHIYPTLLEDTSRPPSCEMAEKIFQFVFQFLISVTQKKDFVVNQVKWNGRGFEVYRCDIPRNLIQSPAVIRDLPRYARKEIIDIALEIEHVRFIDDLLPEWQLYVACLRYWRTHALGICDKFHMYSMLTCLIYKLATSKIGYYNSLSTFEEEYRYIIKFLQVQRDESNIEPELFSTSLAWMQIDTLDCLLAAPFFIFHSQVNPTLSYGDQFKRHIVYGFSQFQCALVASMDLNALLDWPYEEPKIANLYNGTLLYNLYVNFQSCEDMDTYKNNIFKNSPTLLNAFNVLYNLLEENEMIN